MKKSPIAVIAGAALAATPFAAGATTTAPPAPVAAEAPAGQPITQGPATATLIDSYFSTAATQLVVIIELTSTEKVTADTYGSVYIGPTGQQVEPTDDIAPDEIFPGATGLIVLAFPASAPGGTLMFGVYDDDYNDISFEIPVPA